MSKPVAILDICWKPFSSRTPGKAVGGFLRYVQYRDHHDNTPRDLDAATRYVAHRNRSAGRGLLFGPGGLAGDAERRHLVDYIARSGRGLPPPEARAPALRRGWYQMVLSPRNARGLDLQSVTKAALEWLERDLGPAAKLPPWIAAEHRNTAHRHVHVVMPARRSVGHGRYRAVIITRRRLAGMNRAITGEILRQRGERAELRERHGRRLDRVVHQVARCALGQPRTSVAERLAEDEEQSRERSRSRGA